MHGERRCNLSNSQMSLLKTTKPIRSRLLTRHYVGHDGFVVPKDFDEFHDRFPQQVCHWVNRHVDRSTQKEDVED